MNAFCGNCEKKADPDAKMWSYCHEDLTKNRYVEEEPDIKVKKNAKKTPDSRTWNVLHEIWRIIR